MIALLANPKSGSGDAGEAEALIRERDHEVVRFDLERADEAVAARPSRIIVAGGDGSVGCGAAAAALAGVALGVVPIGTANDFARALELPTELEPAVELAANGSRTVALDLGRCGRRPFVNAASAGLPPVAAEKAHGLKRVLGPLAYTVGALRAGLFAKPVACRVSVDRSPLFDGRAWQVIVGITGAFGAGADVDADPTDGELDVVAIEARSRARLVVHGYGLRTGQVEEQPGVVSGRGAEIVVETDGDAGFNVDGELVADRRLRFRVEPRAFELVVGR